MISVRSRRPYSSELSINHVEHSAAPHATTAADPVPDLLADRAVRGAEVRPGDANSQGLADRRARRGRSDLRGDHSPERLRPARRGGLRAGAGARDASTIIAPGSTRPPSGTAVPTASSRPIESSRTPAASGSRRSGNSIPTQGGFWREVSVRMIANRQLYTFILNVEDSVYAKVRPSFDALVAATAIHGPQHRRRPAGEGVEPVDSARVQVRTRPARRLGPGPRSQRGGAPLRQWAAPRRLVRQSSGAGSSPSQPRPGRAGQAASRTSSAAKTPIAK